MPALITKGLTSKAIITIGLGATNNGPLYIALAASIDGIHVKVIFSEVVVQAEALNTANYLISGIPSGLTILGITQETLLSYILTTTPQNVNQSYTVIATGIHDLAGNLI